jgi:hypothetical protein
MLLNLCKKNFKCLNNVNVILMPLLDTKYSSILVINVDILYDYDSLIFGNLFHNALLHRFFSKNVGTRLVVKDN